MNKNNIVDLDEALNSSIDDEMTIKEFLKTCLIKLWQEGEGFSGKRPLGNSGWYYDVIYALARNNILKSVKTVDEYGEIEYNLAKGEENRADKLVTQMIEHIFTK